MQPSLPDRSMGKVPTTGFVPTDAIQDSARDLTTAPADQAMCRRGYPPVTAKSGRIALIPQGRADTVRAL